MCGKECETSVVGCCALACTHRWMCIGDDSIVRIVRMELPVVTGMTDCIFFFCARKGQILQWQQHFLPPQTEMQRCTCATAVAALHCENSENISTEQNADVLVSRSLLTQGYSHWKNILRADYVNGRDTKVVYCLVPPRV